MAEIKESPSNSNESIEILFETLRVACNSNAQHFSTDDSEQGKRLHGAFENIIQCVNTIEPPIKEINSVVKNYDCDENCPGNGFRSFISVIISSINYTLQICNKISAKKDNFWFKKSSFIRDVESCSELLCTLHTSLTILLIIKDWGGPDELFVESPHSVHELMSMLGNINLYCFYGRCLGFQFCEAMRPILKFLSLTMAIFSEAYYNSGSFLQLATNSIWTSGKYVLDPDTRARRIVNISQNADVEFCKAYWFLAESQFMMSLPPLLSMPVAVCHEITIPPEPLKYLRDDGTILDVLPPTVHIGPQSLSLRLLSHVARESMVGASKQQQRKLEPKCSSLMFHCHGGGFVSQSPKSHEIYLRDWAHRLNIPILSVDYSLAPGAPFPRAIEEVFYAYCWVINHCELLGSTGENIIFAGDSAGGNLCVSLAIKCIENGIRLPDGIFLAYVPLRVEFNPSPSRLLCYMDPLLPFGFMMRCLKAYACGADNNNEDGPSDMTKYEQNGGYSSAGATVGSTAPMSPDTESFEEVSESDLLELQAHKSPVSESSDTLTNVSLSSQPMSTSDNNTFTEINVDESQKYVSEFLEKYVLESDTDTDATKIASQNTPVPSTSVKTNGETSGPCLDQTQQKRFSGFLMSLASRIKTWKNKRHLSPAQLYLDDDKQKSLLEEFKFSVPKSHYLSPYFAPDEVLKQLPPIRIVTVEMDPCLDDCVSFAKKLKRLKNNVHLDVLTGLPHGFLNFTAMCKEANEGSILCTDRMKELLNLNEQQQSQSVIN